MAIRTPPAWGVEKLKDTFSSAGTSAPGDYWPNATPLTAPQIRRIGFADIRYALARGYEDLGAYRTDVVFLCVIYPIVGLFMARMAFQSDMLPLIFPLASGFALIGPFAAVGLNEMSRRRELGLEPTWAAGFGIFRSPALIRILLLGLVLVGVFLAWLVAANLIYNQTLGPRAPASASQFLQDVLFTGAGRTMAVVGIGVGFVMALLVLALSAVSFPLLLDRNVSLETAVRTSFGAFAANPVTMIVWGAVITAGLLIGSIPALLGLIVVMPLLGHATWHLYRRIVAV